MCTDNSIIVNPLEFPRPAGACDVGGSADSWLSQSLAGGGGPGPTSTFRYVSPDGHDGNSGSLSNPWKTLPHGIGRISELMPDLSNDPVLRLLGAFQVTSPLSFDESNTGINGRKLTLVDGTDDQSAVISGGARVTGWTLFSGSIYRSNYTGNAPLNIYVNGVRYQQALRSGRLNGTVALTPTGYTTTSDAILSEPNPAGVRFGYYGTFLRPQNRVAGVAGNAISMVPLAHMRITDTPGFAYHFWDSFLGYDNTIPSYVYNVKADFLADATPGTFYCDSVAGKLYLCPFIEHDPTTAVIEVPIGLENIILFDGATDVTLDGIIVEHGDYAMTDGFVERALGQGYFDSGHAPVVTGSLSGGGDYTNLDQSVPLMQSLPAAVVVNDSTRVNVTHYSRIQHHAAMGLRFEGLCSDCEVLGSAVDDVGSNGIAIGHVSQATDVACSDNIRIRDCKITNVGREFFTGSGIHDVFMSNSIIERNEISNCAYMGISHSVGATINYSWSTKRVGNISRYNLIHDVMQQITDGAAIYASGHQGDYLLWLENYVYNVGNSLLSPALPQSPSYWDQYTDHLRMSGCVLVAKSGEAAMYVVQNKSPNVNEILTNYSNTSTLTIVTLEGDGAAPNVNTPFTVNSNVLLIPAAATIAAAAGPAEPYRSNL